MDERKPYVVRIMGIDHTMLLTEDDARRRYGDRARLVDEAPPNKAQRPRNKARQPANKE